MSENTEVQSNESAQSSEQNTEETIVVTKSAEELAKRLKEVSLEAKQNRQKNAELKKQFEEEKKKQLAEQGQYKELAEVYQRKATELESQTQKFKEMFALKLVSDAVEVEATRLGARNVEDVLRLIPMDQIPIDDQFNVDRNSVKVMMEDFKKNRDYLFAGRPGPKVADASPAKVETKKQKSIDEMSAEEIQSILKTKFNKR